MNTQKNAVEATKLYERIFSIKRDLEAVEGAETFQVKAVCSWGSTTGSVTYIIDKRYARRAGIKYFGDQLAEAEKELRKLGFDPKGLL